MLVKGLIIPGDILLSDKNPRGNVTKTHEGALLSRVLWSNFREGFHQIAIYHQELLISIMTYMFSSVFNNIFNYLNIMNYSDFTSKMSGFPTSKWEDKVTATKIIGSSTLMKTLMRGSS